MEPVTVIRGRGPLVLAQPHSGTYVPLDIYTRLNDHGRDLIDTDWHIPTLYEGLAPHATVVRANFNRYVIDANRDPEGKSLYPGQNTTELVPVTTFDGAPIWRAPLTEDDTAARVINFHRPYHDALSVALEEARRECGFAVLYDCHSIRSCIPHLFDGRLPDLNIGTNDGASCAPAIAETVMAVCEGQSAYTHVLNGRFKGGWTTRHYGRPEKGLHAVQMELSQINYLKTEGPPFAYDRAAAANLRDVLAAILTEIQKTLENDFLKEVRL
ncbi:MAG: N-formylglutamate deformylase [Pseudomonadota bacterium]